MSKNRPLNRSCLLLYKVLRKSNLEIIESNMSFSLSFLCMQLIGDVSAELVEYRLALHGDHAVHQPRYVHLHHPSAIVVAAHGDIAYLPLHQQANRKDNVIDGLESPAIVLVVERLRDDRVGSPVRDSEGWRGIEEICAKIVSENISDGTLALRVEKGQISRTIFRVNQNSGSAATRLAYIGQ